MIGWLQGTVTDKTPPFLLLNVSGVGFIIQSPLSAFQHIHEGKEIALHTKLLIKDEEVFIYGFIQKDELKMFEDLISVSGVGPKSALNFLSRFSPQEIARAIDDENLDLLTTVPKIGKKLASKIVLELKGKLTFEEKSSAYNNAVHALCSLGLTRSEAISRLKGLPTDVAVEELVRLALRK
jgi:Holliday junction DNA helicase RuvA